jgi:hypothetical protein
MSFWAEWTQQVLAELRERAKRLQAKVRMRRVVAATLER